MTPTEIAHAIMGPLVEKTFQRNEQLTVDEAQKLMCLLGTYKLALETMALETMALDNNSVPSATPEERRKYAYDATNEALLRSEARLIEMGQVNISSTTGAPKPGIHLVN